MESSEKSNRLFNTDLLRSFVAVIDARSFTAASRHLNSTQSTTSQKIMRLEEAAGVRLVDRGRDGITPTEAGARLLGYARRILALNDEAAAVMSGAARAITLRLGLPEDFASGRVTRALADFIRQHPNTKLEVTSGLSRDLNRAYLQGELDLVLVKQHRGEARGAMHWPEPLAWFQGAGHALDECDPLPLVAFPSNGLYRTQMTAALDSAGRRWRLVYTSSSLAGLLSAIDAGLGISLLPRRVVGLGLDEIPSLPNVDAMEIAIHQADPNTPFVSEIVQILADAVGK
ncbi:LysR family transcriptional regulator [Leisingera daeponensis]|uniref:LysR family transcriptional regulator n=1 Tax=Leisingera daeponensis TaxID=405746 RepID=A0ABS7NLM0_9RHOB|nr:LysR family transcriptional regulator [Leisingera daeponensis]MBY6142103.1 LysR family transcriptional regulator [Leisingera daeponensis]